VGDITGKPGTVIDYEIYGNETGEITASYSPGIDIGLGAGFFGGDFEAVVDREVRRLNVR